MFSVDDLVFNGTLNAATDSENTILSDVTFDNVNTANTTSTIDGGLNIAGNAMLTLASGTLDIFDTDLTVEDSIDIVISGDSATTGGALTIVYIDFDV